METGFVILLLILIVLILASISFTAIKKDRKRYEDLLQEQHTKVATLHQTLGELKEKNHELISYLEKRDEKIDFLTDELGEEKGRYQKVLSQKKSSETRMGLIAEQLLPILPSCPYAPDNMHFLGKPIDFLVVDFDAGEIVFLEVKSGNAKESSRQKTIKNMIKEGRVYYEKLRINENGVKITREDNYEQTVLHLSKKQRKS
jgi:predicted Holliday junction resolvase-like endonuclease